jgi:hypothetical protein
MTTILWQMGFIAYVEAHKGNMCTNYHLLNLDDHNSQITWYMLCKRHGGWGWIWLFYKHL